MQSPRPLFAIAAGAILCAASAGWPQSNPQDGINQNLQERAAREREYHVRIESDSGPPPFPTGFSAPKDFFQLPSRAEPPLLPNVRDIPGPVVPRTTGKSVVNSEVQLRDSQQRRQLELQTQTQAQPQVPGVVDPRGQQAQQIQQQGFEREQRAQDLDSSIMRDSARAIGTKP